MCCQEDSEIFCKVLILITEVSNVDTNVRGADSISQEKKSLEQEMYNRV